MFNGASRIVVMDCSATLAYNNVVKGDIGRIRWSRDGDILSLLEWVLELLDCLPG
jgi:hypothetical protein